MLSPPIDKSKAQEDNAPSVSVVIAAYNAEKTIGPLIAEALKQGGEEAEILVIDDGSTDRTSAEVSAFGIRYIFQENCGPAAARNHGARLARSPIILFLDSDVGPATDCFKEMLEPFSDPTVVAVQGTLLTQQTEAIPGYCQAEIEYKQKRCRRERYVDSIAAGIFAIRKNVFMHYGGFSEQFRMAAAEDTDLSYRMASDGHRILFNSKACVYHPQLTTLSAYTRLKFWRGYWRALLYRRNPNKVLKDSYTPHLQRIQVASMFFAPLWMPAVAWVAGAPALIAACALWIATTLPSTWYVGRSAGFRAGLISPLMQGLSAAALAVGLALGTMREVLLHRCLGTPASVAPRTGLKVPKRLWQRVCKRVVDLVAGMTALLVLSPLLCFLAVLVKATSRGPIFFFQQRTGQGGCPFVVVKFRTMTTDARVEEGSETQADDPRITPLGSWMRRTGLDELPQLANVVLGQMSLVGPRPLLQWENDLCNQRQARRLEAKPGITGLSLVHGRNAIPWDQRIEWDVRYVEDASLLLDFTIMLQTIPVVFRAANAYLEDEEEETLVEPTPVRHDRDFG